MSTLPPPAGATLRVGLVQMNSTADVGANLTAVAALASRAASSGADLICLPEAFSYRGRFDRAIPEPLDGRVVSVLSELAANLRATILGGGFWEASEDPDRPYNSSVLIGPDGSLVACYRKLHLFRISIEDELVEDEGSFTSAGAALVTATVGSFTLGLMTCYDVRFPEQARALVLKEAQVLAVPANFAMQTGRDHWEVLLRARAIENHAYVLAPAQVGGADGWTAYGRSLVVDPWGTVIAQAADAEGVVLADLETSRLAEVRSTLPTLTSRRPDVYGNPGDQ